MAHSHERITMASTALPAAQPIVNIGLLPTMTAADFTNGNNFQNNGGQFLFVENSTAGAITITPDAFPSGATAIPPDGLTPADRSISIPAAVASVPGQKMIGPFPPSIYNNGSGQVTLAFSATGLTIAVVSFAANPN